ncbi:MAG TPA: hypothetical protein VMT85_09380 [Thermoanaerobaculia bacterium]|nr:hypothetical protein [Thermoanaerobaculia bacterium]
MPDLPPFPPDPDAPDAPGDFDPSSTADETPADETPADEEHAHEAPAGEPRDESAEGDGVEETATSTSGLDELRQALITRLGETQQSLLGLIEHFQAEQAHASAATESRVAALEQELEALRATRAEQETALEDAERVRSEQQDALAAAERARAEADQAREEASARLVEAEEELEAERRRAGEAAQPALPGDEEPLPATGFAGRSPLVAIRHSIAALDAASTQTEVLSRLLEEATAHAGRAALLLPEEGADRLTVWNATGFGDALEQGMEAEPGASIRRALEGRPVGGDEARWEVDDLTPSDAVAIPMILRDRVRAVLYADRTDESHPFEPDALQILTYCASEALETLPLRSIRPAGTLVDATPPLEIAEEEAEPAAVGEPPAEALEAPESEWPEEAAALEAAELAGAEPAEAAPEEDLEAGQTPAAATPTSSAEEDTTAPVEAHESAEPAEAGGTPSFVSAVDEPAWEAMEEAETAEEAEEAAAAEEPSVAEPTFQPSAETVAGEALEEEQEQEQEREREEGERQPDAWDLLEEPEPPATEPAATERPPSLTAVPPPLPHESSATTREPEATTLPGWTASVAESPSAGDDAAVAEEEMLLPPIDDSTADEVPDEVPDELQDDETVAEPEPTLVGDGGGSQAAALELAPQEAGEPEETEDEDGGDGAIDEFRTQAVRLDQITSRLPTADAPQPRSSEVVPPSDVQGPGWAFTGAALRGSQAANEDPMHEEARRLARLLVSEIKLYNEEQIEEGRRQGNIYRFLKEPIDRSRVLYDERIDERVRSDSNYYQEELVRSLANGDRGLLGL